MRLFGSGLAICVAALACAQSKGPEVEAFAPAQVAADLLKEKSGADGAFIAAGMVDAKKHLADDLSKMLVYPNETIVVVSLTGAQIKQAFERSLSLYPQPNWGFLQISGFEVTFSPEAPTNQRIRSVAVGTTKLDESKTYNIAMPVGLARGGYGYFKIWNETKIVSTVPDTTVERVLAGKRSADSKPRWVALSSQL